MKKDEKSDRLKRRERRQQIKEGQMGGPANACVNLTNEMQVCPLPQKKTAYESRKTQKSGKDDNEIKKGGRCHYDEESETRFYEETRF